MKLFVNYFHYWIIFINLTSIVRGRDFRCPLINDPLNVIHLPHEYDCSLFYKCDWGRAVLQNCPEYLHWSISADRCEWPEIADCRLSGETTTASDGQTTTVELEVTIVTDDGETTSNSYDPRCPLINDPLNVIHLPHEYDCSLFYKCDWGRAVLQNCPEYLHWSISADRCEWPEIADCRLSGETTTASDGQTTTVELEVTIVTDDGETISNICDPRCPLRNEEGSKVVHLPHEFDCTLFYKCDWCRAILHECPAGLYFDPFLSVCNYPEEVACRFVAI